MSEDPRGITSRPLDNDEVAALHAAAPPSGRIRIRPAGWREVRLTWRQNGGTREVIAPWRLALRAYRVARRLS
jgi:hypothetical protein